MTRQQRRFVRATTRRPRRGMTLVEMLVAVVMIGVAIVGLMGVSGSAATGMGNGMRHTIAASVAQARLDSLTSLSCASLESGAGSGSTLTRGVKESWTVTDGRNIKTIQVNITVPRRKSTIKYETIVPCRDT